jgi:hypothetical protein
MDLYGEEGSMAPVPVKVTYNPSTNKLIFTNNQDVDLSPGDILEWIFEGVPSDCVPGILFEHQLDVPGAAFGPFQALMLIGNTVVGRGNLGISRVYEYHAQLLDVNGVRTTSEDVGVVHNQVSIPDMSPITVIPCQIITEQGVTKVHIGDIDTLKLFVGDTAIWYVSGLPSDAFVNLIFLLSSGDSVTQPFRYVLFDRGVDGEGSTVLRVIGVDFEPGTTDSFTYAVQVRNFPGQVIHPGDDPQIDNLGPPPQG